MEAAILALLEILHTRKTASLTHLVSRSPASHSRQNDMNALQCQRSPAKDNYENAVPAQKYTGTAFPRVPARLQVLLYTG